MPIDLYYFDLSPPVRSVMLTAKAIGLELNIIPLDLPNNEQMHPNFLTLNPQHTVPVIVDGDLVIFESGAINAYLVSKYAKDDGLYPKDPKKRAIIDRNLFFFTITLFPLASGFLIPVTFFGEEPKVERLEKVIGAFERMEMMLGDKKFFCGDNITIADHCFVAVLSVYVQCDVYDFTKFPKLLAWLERSASEMPGYEEVNNTGAKKLAGLFKQKYIHYKEKMTK